MEEGGSSGAGLEGKVVVNFGYNIYSNAQGANSVSNRISNRTGAIVCNIGLLSITNIGMLLVYIV